jgi:hypothetical protein
MVTVIKEYKRNQNTLVYLFLGKEPTLTIQNEFPLPFLMIYMSILFSFESL